MLRLKMTPHEKKTGSSLRVNAMYLHSAGFILVKKNLFDNVIWYVQLISWESEDNRLKSKNKIFRPLFSILKNAYTFNKETPTLFLHIKWRVCSEIVNTRTKMFTSIVHTGFQIDRPQLNSLNDKILPSLLNQKREIKKNDEKMKKWKNIDVNKYEWNNKKKGVLLFS